MHAVTVPWYEYSIYSYGSGEPSLSYRNFITLSLDCARGPLSVLYTLK